MALLFSVAVRSFATVIKQRFSNNFPLFLLFLTRIILAQSGLMVLEFLLKKDHSKIMNKDKLGRFVPTTNETFF